MNVKCNANDVITRIKTVIKVNSDREMADYFGLGKTTITSKRQRNSIPLEEAVRVALDFSMSLDWLILGRGCVGIDDNEHEQPRSTSGATGLFQDFDGGYNLDVAHLCEAITTIERRVRYWNRSVSDSEKATLIVSQYQHFLEQAAKPAGAST